MSLFIIDVLHITKWGLFLAEEPNTTAFDISELLIPLGIISLIVLLVLLNNWLFNRLQSLRQTENTFKRIIALLVILIGMFAFIFTLPIDLKKQLKIVEFLAILLSAAIALSSTTVLGNLIAGIMNSSIKRFRNGDWIKIGDIRGKVTRKSIFHTEIQLEDSNFATIPNLYVATHPVMLTIQNNTVVSTKVSLGYEVSRIRIEQCLLKAATTTGLSNPYVYITELGDYSVVYKLHGFLEDSSKILTKTSMLNGNVLDALHHAKIEIVSPSFMNQKQIDKQQFIPKDHIVNPIATEKQESPEELVFAEAIKSEVIEKKKDFLLQIEKKKELFKEKLKGLGEEIEIEKTKSNIRRLDELKEKIEKNIEEQIKKNKALE